MVVGRGFYTDRTEAFPLDRKTLRKIGLRSLFMNAGFNGETHESIGWTWALEPGLKKIHTNEADLALSMGHNLEFVDAGFYLSTFAMGVTLALEAQKADLDTLRSVRTNAALCAKGIGDALFKGLIIPFAASGCAILASSGNVAGAVLFVLITALLSLLLRFAMLQYGYSQSTRAIEKLRKHSEILAESARIAGAVIIGATVVWFGSTISFSISTLITSSSSLELTSALNDVVPGCVLVVMTLWIYRLLTKKKWPLAKCFILILVIGMIGAFFGIWPGSYNTPISWPWMS